MPDSPSPPIAQTQTLSDDLAPAETWIAGFSNGESAICAVLSTVVIGIGRWLFTRKKMLSAQPLTSIHNHCRKPKSQSAATQAATAQ